jgi:hypothetical protein
MKQKILTFAQDGRMGWKHFVESNDNFYNVWKYYRLPGNCMKALAWISVEEGARMFLVWHYSPPSDSSLGMDIRTSAVTGNPSELYWWSLAGRPGMGHAELDELASAVKEIRSYERIINKMYRLAYCPIQTQGNYAYANGFWLYGFTGTILVIQNSQVGTWPYSSKYSFSSNDQIFINDDGTFRDYTPLTTPRSIHFSFNDSSRPRVFDIASSNEITYDSVLKYTVDVDPGSGKLLFAGSQEEADRLHQMMMNVSSANSTVDVHPDPAFRTRSEYIGGASIYLGVGRNYDLDRYEAMSWLKFNIPDLSGKAIVSAKLLFRPNNQFAAGNPTDIRATYVSDDSWWVDRNTYVGNISNDWPVSSYSVTLPSSQVIMNEYVSMDITPWLSLAGEGSGQTLSIRLDRTVTGDAGCTLGGIYLEIELVNVLLPGDANNDGMVDVGDLGILAANYGLTSDAAWAQGDFNGDGKVDVGDLGILAANYGTGASGADFDADYAKVFGTAALEDADEAKDETSSSGCSDLGLPWVAGLLFMGLMLIRED